MSQKKIFLLLVSVLFLLLNTHAFAFLDEECCNTCGDNCFNSYNSSNNNNHTPPPCRPCVYPPDYVPPPPLYPPSTPGVVIGVEAGYAITHWDNLDEFPFPPPFFDIDDNGFAARGWLGIDFTKYFGIEAGFDYLPSAEINHTPPLPPPPHPGFFGGSHELRINSWAVDLLAKFYLPISCRFNIYGKVGANYMHVNKDPLAFIAGDGDFGDSTGHFGPAVGAGLSYEISRNFFFNADWLRLTGYPRVKTGYQPNPDMFLIGLSYRFPAALWANKCCPCD